MGEVTAGSVIRGRYRLEHRLGRGGMGDVWSAADLELHHPVAVKLIVPEHADDPSILSRFLHEARSAASLQSPHVVHILDFGMDGERAFIAMERLEGESLADRLKRESRLPLALTARIVEQVGKAVSLAHEAQLVHRDLKPDNVFLVGSGPDASDDDVLAKVLDFGLVKSHKAGEEPEAARTDTGVMLGSPYYMSPEQARGRRELDPRSDLWAMGVIAYECVTGMRPFVGSSLGEVILMICVEPPPIPSEVARVPAGFDAWFARATSRDIGHRFQSARQVSESLRRVLLGEAGPASVGAESAADTPAPSPLDPDAAPPATLRGSLATRGKGFAASDEMEATTLPRTHSAPAGPHPAPPQVALPSTRASGPSGLAIAAAVVVLGAVAWFAASSLGLLAP